MFKEFVKGWGKHLDFMILDIICLEISVLIAYVIRNGWNPVAGNAGLYRNLMLVLVIIDICAVFFLNSYKEVVRRGYLAEIKKVIMHSGWVMLGLVVWMFLIGQSNLYSRRIIVTMYPISIILMTVARLLWKSVVRIHIRKRKGLRKVLVVTTELRAKQVVRELLIPFRDYMIDGIVLYDYAAKAFEKEYDGIPVCAGREDMIPYTQNHIVDEVFLDLDDEREICALMNVFVNMGLTVHINLIRSASFLENKKIHPLGKLTVVSASMKFVSPRQIFMKRMMDICGGLVGLVLTGIAFLIFAPIIYCQSPGPIFFSQIRVGRNGRVFKIYKFRTMYPDAEERKKELMAQNKMTGFMFKMDNDPRIFPIGHFLREKSIDELPQFWNVLKGDMSLVGTRPPTLDEYQQYEARHRKRLAMKPGLTGMWQASGRSDITDFEEVVALDAKYLQEWNILLDVKLIWMTAIGVLNGSGAV